MKFYQAKRRRGTKRRTLGIDVGDVTFPGNWIQTSAEATSPCARRKLKFSLDAEVCYRSGNVCVRIVVRNCSRAEHDSAGNIPFTNAGDPRRKRVAGAASSEIVVEDIGARSDIDCDCRGSRVAGSVRGLISKTVHANEVVGGNVGKTSIRIEGQRAFGRIGQSYCRKIRIRAGGIVVQNA